MPAHDTLKQPFPYSLPKEKIKILLLEGISETAVRVLQGSVARRVAHDHIAPRFKVDHRGDDLTSISVV